MHLDVFGLADPISPVGGLVFHGGIPPAVKMEDMVGPGEVQARAPGLQGQDEQGQAAAIGLEALHHLIPLLFGGPAVQEEDFPAEGFLQVKLQNLAHFGKLSEDQGPVFDLEDFLHHLRQSGQLPRAVRDRGNYRPETGRDGCRPA